MAVAAAPRPDDGFIDGDRVQLDETEVITARKAIMSNSVFRAGNRSLMQPSASEILGGLLEKFQQNGESLEIGGTYHEITRC